MPLDRSNRTRAAAYLRGEIDNFKLDDETLGLSTKDRALVDVSLKIWHYYDDIRCHSVRATPETWELLTRCLAYFHSDLEEPIDYRSAPQCAPFPTLALWQAHQHLLEA